MDRVFYRQMTPWQNFKPQPAILTRNIQVKEKDAYKLSCGFAENGVYWMLNEIYISSESLSKNYKDNRIFINVKHELVIRYLTMDDDKSFYRFHIFL